MTAALQHPHILPLFDSGEAGGFLYYVMPYVEGETLPASSIARSSWRSTKRCTSRGSRRRAGLRAPAWRDPSRHQAGEHSPARRPADGRRLRHRARRQRGGGRRMTETGLSLGTPQYMSPEQATAEKEITAAADIYSLGGVLYEMLAGEPPHTGTIGAADHHEDHRPRPRPVRTSCGRPCRRTSRRRWRTSLAKIPGGSLRERESVRRRAGESDVHDAA